MRNRIPFFFFRWEERANDVEMNVLMLTLYRVQFFISRVIYKGVREN